MPPSKRNQQQSEEEDYSEEDDLDQQEEVVVRKPKVERLDNMKNLKKIVINVSMTQYSVVTEAAQQLGWKVQCSTDSGDWDVFWTDWHIQPDVLIKMHLFQKISHYPGIQSLARKNLLGLHLMSMREVFLQQYDFFPLTWMLPQQYVQFRTYFQSRPKGKARTYIVKPQADCQGKGIFLTRKIESIQNGKHYVVQRYLSRPYLIDNLKFDMRIYVLIGSLNPLRIYLFQDGLARFATQPYLEPTANNLEKQYVHLTNYAINKKNPKFIFNNNASNMGIGHKRSLTCVYKQLKNKGVNIEQLKNKIKDLIIKTIITSLPNMSHMYKCSQPQDYTGNMCFHILGFDVMMKSDAQPVLLQVNHTPSFTADTPLDFKIKKGLIKDTLRLMNVNLKKKTQLYNLCMENNQNRLLTGKRNILQGKQRQDKIQKYEQQRQQYQKQNLGGFQVIYPTKVQERNAVYNKLIGHSTKRYFQEKGSVRIRMAQKQSKRLARIQYKQLKNNKKLQNYKDKNPSVQDYSESKQSISQALQGRITNNNVSNNLSAPFSQRHISTQYKHMTIDDGEGAMRRQPMQKQRRSQIIQTPSLKFSRQDRANSQRIVPSLIKCLKTSKGIKTDSAKVHQKRNYTPVKLVPQKIPQLPQIIDNSCQLLQKSNLIRGSEYDRRRYIKAPIADKLLPHRQTNAKARLMTKSTSIVQPSKDELNSRQNTSGLMVKKMFQDKLISRKKTLSYNPFAQPRKEGTRISYVAFQSNYNPNFADLQPNGQYLMPKIFYLNFEPEKNQNQNQKFLMSRNTESQAK